MVGAVSRANSATSPDLVMLRKAIERVCIFAIVCLLSRQISCCFIGAYITDYVMMANRNYEQA